MSVHGNVYLSRVLNDSGHGNVFFVECCMQWAVKVCFFGVQYAVDM